MIKCCNSLTALKAIACLRVCCQCFGAPADSAHVTGRDVFFKMSFAFAE